MRGFSALAISLVWGYSIRIQTPECLCQPAEPKNKQWHADVNVHWMGPQHLPNTQSLPESFRQPDFSRAFPVTNVQFTKVWKKLDLYAGCENLFDFRQIRPIINWQNPFGDYFDTAFAWGPTRGRELYVGVRMRW